MSMLSGVFLPVRLREKFATTWSCSLVRAFRTGLPIQSLSESVPNDDWGLVSLLLVGFLHFITDKNQLFWKAIEHWSKMFKFNCWRWSRSCWRWSRSLHWRISTLHYLSFQTNSIFDFSNCARLVYTNNNATLKDAKFFQSAYVKYSIKRNVVLRHSFLAYNTMQSILFK